jgi:hypothetical protein
MNWPILSALYRLLHAWEDHSMFCERFPYISLLDEAVISASYLNKFIHLKKSGPPIPLLEALVALRGAESTDPRDKVFAALGLSTNKENVEPDYLLDVSTVFRNTAMRIIQINLNCPFWAIVFTL